jgi:Carboxypeptidase regulatory-like domain
MRPLAIAVLSFVFAFAVFGQSDRGTITGTISDPSGAVAAGAPVEIRNVENGLVYRAASSATGNYTLAQLPAGQYELAVTVPGFKKYVRKSITVDVAETYRVDVTLEVGSNSESVTVTEAAPLLKTESGELSHTVTTDTMNNLPVMGIGGAAGSSGMRNPYAVVQLLPGTTYSPDVDIRINGMPANTQAMRIEGQDATNGWYSAQSQTQGSVDAIQEFAVQTSNYAAELGQAGGGLFNVTMRSGTNAPARRLPMTGMGICCGLASGETTGALTLAALSRFPRCSTGMTGRSSFSTSSTLARPPSPTTYRPLSLPRPIAVETSPRR